MMPPDFLFVVQQQRRREMLQEAQQARLLRAARRTPTGGERAFQYLIWRVGHTLLSWGCALQMAGRVLPFSEKGCCVCLQ
jgi:hypothetical protein